MTSAKRGAVKRKARFEPPQFLNVDLEIGARRKLDVLAAELAPRLFELHRGKIGALHRVHYEVAQCASDVDTTLLALIGAVKQLTPGARRLWNRAELREFNIGIQGGFEPFALELVVPGSTLAQVVALGARIAVTVYAPCAVARRRTRT